MTKLAPRFRKLALLAHIITSIGWIGAVITYLILAIVTKTNQDIQMVRAIYLTLDPITEYTLVPLAFASLLSGLIMSLVSSWGLIKHYWVLVKLVLTIISTIVLLGFTRTMSYMAGVASDPKMSVADLRAMGAGMGHAVGALVVLLIITILSVYKPRGMTPYGWRKQRKESQS